MPTYDFEIAAGKIEIETYREQVELTELIDFASRDNPRRGFLFVSKLLGKYVPVRPRRLTAIFQRLADLIGRVSGPVVMMGLAETATGLGQGVYDAYKMNSASEMFYLHTTRYPLKGAEISFGFQEVHSHATRHFVYEPFSEFQLIYQNAETLILVDDEITTGNTLLNLVQEYLKLNPGIKTVYFVTMVSWLQPDRIQEMVNQLNRPIGVCSLVQGRFSFSRNPAFESQLPDRLSIETPSMNPRHDLGRLGIQSLDFDRLLPKIGNLDFQGERLLVLGTGEFNYLPFRLAERLEKQGNDVLFQSTARSPIQLGDGISSKLSFPDHHGEGVPNYLYNAPADRKVIILYETEEMKRRHPLPDSLSAHKLALYDSHN